MASFKIGVERPDKDGLPGLSRGKGTPWERSPIKLIRLAKYVPIIIGGNTRKGKNSVTYFAN